MEYLILVLIGIIILFLAFNGANKIRKRKKIEEIQKAWTHPKNEWFNFNNIRRYADIIDENSFHRLTDQTIEDIDFYELFAFIDRTTSKVGQQFLYKKITEPTNATTDSLQQYLNSFSNDQELREEVQLELLKLNNEGAYFISSLLKDKLLQKPAWYNFLYLDIFVLVCLIILSLKFPVLLIALIFPVALNLFLHFRNKNNTMQFLRSFPQLDNLIKVSKALMKKGGLFYEKQVEESIISLRTFQQKVPLINFHNGSESMIGSELNQLGTYFNELIKAIFLIEVFTLFKLTRELENKKESIQILFNYVGSIDSSISIASLRAGKLKMCIPTFVSNLKELHVKGIYHPLIENCVKNDLSLKGKSILITGSNMSGKSTFLRTLTINSILAQTIYTCFANEFVSPVFKQFTSIRVKDNLFDNKSYYFQEINIMASLLKQVQHSQQNLFVLDEVFKGTNTIERIAAAKAILSYLNHKKNMVIVATHDIELAELLTNEYDLFHFAEIIENNELQFDYCIKEGQLKTRNAIKLLELANYPSEIIMEAKHISGDLEIGVKSGGI